MAKKRTTKKAGRAEPPTCDCLLICDDVLLSQGKGKHFLQGIIGIIQVRGMPATIGGYIAYVRLSNVYSAQKVALAFSSAASGDELFRFEADLPKDSDPLGVYTLILPIPVFEVAEPGRYIFSALHNEVPFAQSPILIHDLTPRESQ